MQNATLATLPPEVLDLIFDFGEEEDSSLSAEDNASSRKKVYHTLSLMSRTLYRATRPRLYSHPLLGVKPNWTKAQGLLSSLQANDRALGRLVRSLRTLPTWVATLSTVDIDTKLAYQLRGQSKAFSWFIAMISACPCPDEVGVSFYTAAQTTKLASALSASLSTLHTLVLQKTEAFKTPKDEAHRFLAKLDTEELPVLDIDGIGRGKGNYKYPRTPFRISQVRFAKPVNADYSYLDIYSSCTAFLPAQTASLHKLVIEEDRLYYYSGMDLFKQAAPHLAELILISRNWRGDRRFRYYGTELVQTYRGMFSTPILHHPFFSLFPLLEHLELHNLRTLSVARLEALSRTSPSLVSLLCPGCLWLADGPEPDRTTPGWNTLLFPPARLAEVLKSFSQLKKVDLGVVPFKDEADFAKLVCSLEEDKVDVKYELCVGP